MADEDVAAQMQQLQRQLQSYDRHLAGLEQSLGELQSAISTLEGIEGNAEQDAKIPVGAGVRLAARIDASAPVLVDIGAGYTTEATVGDALTQLRDRLQATEAAFRTTSADAETIGARMQQLQTSFSA